MTSRTRFHLRRILSAGALAALASSLAFPAAAHALDAPAPGAPAEAAATQPETGAPAAPDPTTTTDAPPESADAPEAALQETPAEPDVAALAAGAELRAAAVSRPPSVTVRPTSGLNPAGGSTITVSGSGFVPDANNEVGIYVVFGPVDPGTYFQDANRFQAAMWLHPGGGASGSPGQGELRADGSFSTTLPPAGGAALTATYTDGNGTPVSCLVTQCYVVTMAAHGVGDRSMDTCTPVSFAGGTATPAVDRTCQPVTTPAGQPSDPGATGGSGVSGTGAGASTASGTSSGGASATLPRTGATGPALPLAGFLALGSGLALLWHDRRAHNAVGSR